MAAAKADRRHALAVELAMETRATGEDLEEIIGRLRANHGRAATFIRALVDAHTEGAALRVLLEARAAHVIEVGEELAGLLDYGEPALFRKAPVPDPVPA